MNCEVGDLAVIVNCSKGEEWVLGHPCTIVARNDHPLTGEPGWQFTPPVKKGRITRDCTVDRYLKPLRDPGDDAVDESLLWFRIPEVDCA